MANEQNLKTFSPSEARKNGRKGGIASGQARKRAKTLKEIGDMIGGLKLTNENKIKVMKAAGISDEDLIKDVAAMYKLASKAEAGDVRAMELLSKLRGQFREVQSVEVSEVKPLVDLTKRKKNGEKK